MQIWIDADACPNSIKEIIFRAANRTKTVVILVANQPINSPPSDFIKKKVVAAGFDVADNHIVEHMVAGDLVITADIPLASEVVDKGGIALNPRGQLYTKENVKQYLSQRDISEELRNTGIIISGPNQLHKRDIAAFANRLDQFLTQHRNVGDGGPIY